MAVKSEQTPLMKQYWEIKSLHQDKILLFRMGDFFEMFFEDAQIAAPIIGVALTSRNKKSAEQTPMCGVPHHSVANPINKLLAHGLKVAICDQVEDPKFAKGIVKRAVTRILSPGMVFDPDTLDEQAFNYLCSVDSKSVSLLEPTTGESFYYEVAGKEEQTKLLDLLRPVEIVLPADQIEVLKSAFGENFVYSSHEKLEGEPTQPESSRRLLSYALSMQGEELRKTLSPNERREYESRLQLGADVLRHLEIFKTYKGDTKGSLFDSVNYAVSAGGSRRLRQWLCFPLTNEKKIAARADLIEQWLNDTSALQKVRGCLKGIGDLERRIGKISHPNAHPRDLKALSHAFESVDEILNYFPDKKEEQRLVRVWKGQIDQTLSEDLPLTFREGGIIQKGISEELDELIDLSTNSQGKILELEARERELTQISSLKVRYNNVFGFYIEVTHTHASKVPLNRYQRKQTLTNAERYTTDELNELEKKVVTARTRRAEVELEIYLQLKKDLLTEMSSFLKIADFLSHLDAICGLAWLALENNYCRPQFASEQGVVVKASRHPVVERTTSFVPNDISLRGGECLLLTGPNMAGKSTLMRQVAILSILAQAGSYVPAKSASLPLFDRIFTRIGASDFLNEGLSTFMVEMKETAVMLKESTPKSLVILDEVGRGTSTYDGLSLAQSILEYLMAERKPTIFFATHYHELTALSEVYPQLINSHMTIHENKGQLRFLYALSSGPAVRSYGIQVARLAGLPATVTRRAETLLHKLESATRGEGSHSSTQLDLWSSSLAEPASAPVDPKVEVFLQKVKDLSIQSMTPLDALNKIAEWQQELS